jgi:predicted kinase
MREAEHNALRLTKDEWMKSLFGPENPASASDVIASAGVTSRKNERVFMRSELRRSSELSRRAGSVRKTTSK